MVANFNIDNKAGVDIGATYTITLSTPEYPAPPANPGDHILGNNGTEWVFVKNNSTTVTIAIYACVQLDASFNAVPITTTLANQLWDVAFAQVAIPPSQYGWVALRGENILSTQQGCGYQAVSVVHFNVGWYPCQQHDFRVRSLPESWSTRPMRLRRPLGGLPRLRGRGRSSNHDPSVCVPPRLRCRGGSSSPSNQYFAVLAPSAPSFSQRWFHSHSAVALHH